jgi:hypothetical protein
MKNEKFAEGNGKMGGAGLCLERLLSCREPASRCVADRKVSVKRW